MTAAAVWAVVTSLLVLVGIVACAQLVLGVMRRI